MEESKVFKRTFEAKQYSKESKEKKALNKHCLTSEYMPSYPYVVIMYRDGKEEDHRVFRSKTEAQEFADS